MEAPKPITPIEFENAENNFLNFNLIFNNNTFQCLFYDINNENIKINIILENNKYEIKLSFIEFKYINKYFKMFDTIKELENDLIGLSNSKKIEISNIHNKELDLCINVLTLDNNKVILHLKNVELNDKEKLKSIIKEINEIKNNNNIIKKEYEEIKKENEEIKKENKEIKKENEEIKKDLKLKDSKIIDLEKEINYLKNEFLKLSKSEKKFKENSEDNNINDKTFKSNIILNKKEKDLILNQFQNKIKKIDLLFNSQIDGTDINKLKNAYLNKPDLIFVIKTKKGRKFGAYSKETFLAQEFNKKDSKAFLFSLDNYAIIKSNNSEYSIWNNRDFDSIQFGGATDLRIYYDFTSNKNYTKEDFKYYDYKNYQKYILNGEQNFSVDILEIFQINFE